MRNNDTPLTDSQAAEYLHKSKSAMAQLRFGNKGPRFARRGRTIYYWKSDIDAWLDAGLTGTGEQAVEQVGA